MKHKLITLECFVRRRLGQKEILNDKMEIIRSSNDINNFVPLHERFDFSGTNDHSPFEFNNKILLKFKDCGIYDYYKDLTIESWKGELTLKSKSKEWRYSGDGTVEILMDIIKKTFLDIIP